MRVDLHSLWDQGSVRARIGLPWDGAHLSAACHAHADEGARGATLYRRRSLAEPLPAASGVRTIHRRAGQKAGTSTIGCTEDGAPDCAAAAQAKPAARSFRGSAVSLI